MRLLFLMLLFLSGCAKKDELADIKQQIEDILTPSPEPVFYATPF